MAIDFISGGKALGETKPAPEPDDELFAGGAVGLTTDELTLTPEVPARFVAVEENV
jgi:hypothetical protein